MKKLFFTLGAVVAMIAATSCGSGVVKSGPTEILLSADQLTEIYSRYSDIEDEFHEGACVVYQGDNNAGLVNLKCQEILPCEYNEIEYVGEGYFIVKKGESYATREEGVVDCNGKIAIPCEYYDGEYYGDGLFRFATSNSYPYNEGLLSAKVEEGATATFKEIAPFTHKEIEYLGEGLFTFEELEDKKHCVRYGIMNSLGEILAPGETYSQVDSFHEGLAAIRTLNPNNKADWHWDEIYGYINNKCEIVLPLAYDFADKFVDGVAIVELNDTYSMIDTTGKTIVSFGKNSKPTSLYYLVDGVIPVLFYDEEKGTFHTDFYNAKGEKAIAETFLYAMYNDLFDKFEVLRQDQSAVYINGKGEVMDLQFDEDDRDLLIKLLDDDLPYDFKDAYGLFE